MKRKSRKVKGIYLSLAEAANQVSDDLVEEARFIEVHENL
jgi:urease gamma subunit